MSTNQSEFLTLSRQIFETYIVLEYPNILEEMAILAEEREYLTQKSKDRAQEKIDKMQDDVEKIQTSSSYFESDLDDEGNSDKGIPSPTMAIGTAQGSKFFDKDEVQREIDGVDQIKSIEENSKEDEQDEDSNLDSEKK